MWEEKVDFLSMKRPWAFPIRSRSITKHDELSLLLSDVNTSWHFADLGVLEFALRVKRDNCEQFSLLDKYHSELGWTDLAPNAEATKIGDVYDR